MTEARNLYRGVVVPMISPFTADGAVDVPAIGRIVEYVLAGGVHGIFALGTTGESQSIHPDDRRRLVETVCRVTAGRVPIYAGISGNCLRESIEAAAAYRRLGADVVVAHPPFYYPLNDAEMHDHFVALADGSPLPLVLYNIPATTKQPIPLAVIDRLRHHSNVAGIKDSAADPQRLEELLAATGGRGGFPVLLGCSALFTHGLRLGGVGLVPSGAHLAAAMYRQMYDAAMADRWPEVERLQASTDATCARYIRGRSLAQSLAMLKLLLEQQGLCTRAVLPPLRPAQDQPAAEPLAQMA